MLKELGRAPSPWDDSITNSKIASQLPRGMLEYREFHILHYFSCLWSFQYSRFAVNQIRSFFTLYWDFIC